MNRISLSVICFVVLMCVPNLEARAQSGADLFQQGLRKEQVEGNLNAAIAIYRRVLAENSSDRSLLAKTLVQLGGAYEKLGSDEAKAAYRRVLRDYADQSAEATTARARLAALAAPTLAARTTEPTLRRIWSGKDVDVEGAPTSDGRLLTFVDWTTGDLAVRDLSAGTNRRLTNKVSGWRSDAFALNSLPSPDGKQVAYEWYTDNGGHEVRVVGMDGSDTRVLYSTPDVTYVEFGGWSPDGKQLLLCTSRKDAFGAELLLLDINAGTTKPVKTLGGAWPGKVRLSPNGKYIAYDYPTSAHDPQHDIYVIPISGGRTSTVVNHPAQDLLLGWTPDGNGILFASDRTGSMSIWLAPVRDGIPLGEPELVRRDAEFSISALGFTSAGSLMYWASPSPVDLFQAEIDPSGRIIGPSRRIIEHYVGANRSADWSPDGERIVYISKRQAGPGSGTLLVRSLADGSETTVPVKLTQLGSPRWSPDGSYILIGARDSLGTDGFYRIDPTSGTTTRVAPGSTPSENRGFFGLSADSKTGFFLARDFAHKIFRIFTRPLDGGAEKDIVKVTNGYNISQAAISPDGGHIAFAVFGDSLGGPPGIKVVPTAGGEARTLAREWIEFNSISWSPDGNYVLFAKVHVTGAPDGSLIPDSSKVPLLLRVRATGGPEEDTGLHAYGIAGLRASPDGKHLLYTAGRGDVEVWLMENFLPRSVKLSSTKTSKNR